MREFFENDPASEAESAAAPASGKLKGKALMALNLKQLRGQRGLTLEQLAQGSGLTRSYLSKVERGISTPSIESALSIASTLGISVEKLFGHSEDEGEPITIVRASDGTGKD